MKVSFYNNITGMFSPACVDVPEHDLVRNTPDGFLSLVGRFDFRTQRIDIEMRDKLLSDARRSSTGEFNESEELTKAALSSVIAVDEASHPHQRAEARLRALSDIQAMERRQTRAMREAHLGIVPTEEDRKNGAMTVAEINARLTELRQLLRE